MQNRCASAARTAPMHSHTLSDIARDISDGRGRRSVKTTLCQHGWVGVRCRRPHPSAWWWRECRSGMNQTPATHRMDALDQRHRPAAVRAAVRLLSTSSSLHSSTRSPAERQSHQLDVPLTGEGKAARTSGLHSYTDGSGLGVRMPSSRDSSVARARERYIKTRTLNCVTFTVDSEPPTPAPTPPVKTLRLAVGSERSQTWLHLAPWGMRRERPKASSRAG